MRADRVLFLARGEPTPYGYFWPGRGEDGPHSTPEGVAKAAKLIGRIIGDDGPWVMVEVHPLPDIDVPINEADVSLLADAVKASQASRRGPSG